MSMMRRTPMKRSAWPSTPAAERVKPVAKPLERPVRYAEPANDPVAAIEKENALQHQGYMALVRLLPCAHCGRAGPSQFCHSDEGKGTGIKTDCRRGWPGCAPCHCLLGSTGKLGREERRRLEDLYAERTRATIVARGEWPARLPLFQLSRTAP